MNNQPDNSTKLTICASETNFWTLKPAECDAVRFQDADGKVILRIDKDFNLTITDPDKVISFWERNLEEYRKVPNYLTGMTIGIYSMAYHLARMQKELQQKAVGNER